MKDYGEIQMPHKWSLNQGDPFGKWIVINATR